MILTLPGVRCLMMLQIKFDCDRPAGLRDMKFMFESVDAQTDDGSSPILKAYLVGELTRYMQY